MKINLYGVGRSGTKAIQLYLILSLIKKYGKIGLNYEPFLWQDHLVRYYNTPGILEHKKLPFFVNEKEIEVYKNSSFLNELNFYENGITKFIQGNGRINLINEVMKPDFNIFVIRDIYDVLSSINSLRWDFFGKKLPKEYDWNKFLLESKNKFSDILNNIKIDLELNSDIGKNALYWYLMNKVAIKQLKKLVIDNKNVFILKFEDIASINNLIEKLGLPQPDVAISEIYGGIIHKNIFYTPKFINFFSYNLKGLWNNLFLRLSLPKLTFKSASGLYVSLNKKSFVDNKLIKRVKNNKKIKIENMELLDYYKKDIENDLLELKAYIIK